MHDLDLLIVVHQLCISYPTKKMGVEGKTFVEELLTLVFANVFQDEVA